MTLQLDIVITTFSSCLQQDTKRRPLYAVPFLLLQNFSLCSAFLIYLNSAVSYS